MKKVTLLLILIFFSCKNPSTKSNEKDETIDDIEYVDLIGSFNRTDLNKDPYRSWFLENYENYELDLETASKLKKLINRKIKIKVIMGTWCSDSRDNVPGFFKLMDHIKFRKRNIELIGLDVDKKNPNEDELQYEIINVPTFIFYNNDKEINRIVELTIESLEKDILKILDGSGYQNAYYGF